MFYSSLDFISMQCRRLKTFSTWINKTPNREQLINSYLTSNIKQWMWENNNWLYINNLRAPESGDARRL